VRPSKLPALVLVLWLISTLSWWAFAFLPLSSTPPEWLTAARAACFGSVESGLPAPYGFMLLVLAPTSFLVGIFLLWGSEIVASVLSVARSPLGTSVFALIAAALIAEGVWVSVKVRAGLAVAAWDQGPQDASDLPAAYPRRAAAAPDFALVDQDGERVSLRSFKGKPVLLTFVFAHCQTLCPLLVQNIKQASPGAPPSEVLMVTLDPWRDTPSALPGIARRWDVPQNFHILSAASVAEVLRVVDAYQVPFERNQTSGDITHPGLVFLVDAQGRLAYTFNNPTPAWIRAGLNRLAATGAHAG
jgi:cytochrome oxidase Cu insertion factor (SCO1/SenC/PrrC family)